MPKPAEGVGQKRRARTSSSIFLMLFFSSRFVSELYISKQGGCAYTCINNHTKRSGYHNRADNLCACLFRNVYYA